MIDVAASALPLLAALALVAAVRPNPEDVTPWRTALLRGAVLTAAYGVVSVQVLSAIGQLDRAGVATAWALAIVAALAVAWRRRSVGWAWPPGRFHPALLLPVAVILGLFALELLIAVVAEPNNWDSQTYHLSRVAHWVDQGSIEPYPTHLLIQNISPPAAEYLILHLRLLGDADRLANTVQWAAGIVCVVAASRVAKQLGAGAAGQVVAALVVATTPLVVLEATSTQNDLVAAAWCVALASFALEEGRRRSTIVFMAITVGLAVATKPTAAAAAAPIVVWWLVRRAGPWQGAGSWQTTAKAALGRMVRDGAILVAGVVVVIGPFLGQVHHDHGNPFGPARTRARYELARHDPAAITVNGLRSVQTVLRTPSDRFNDWMADRVNDVDELLNTEHANFRNPPGVSRFPHTVKLVDEDSGPYPIHFTVVVGAAVAVLVVVRRKRPVQAMAAGTLLAAAALSASLHWNPFISRYFLTVITLGAGVVGWAAERAVARVGRGSAGRRGAAALVVVGVLTAGTAMGIAAIVDGGGRPVRGDRSVFSLDPWSTRFGGDPNKAQPYIDLAGAVRSAGAQRVGLALGPDDWEYPWWLLLGDLDLESAISTDPNRPAAPSSSFDAILCANRDIGCADNVPAGWRIQGAENLLVAFPPGSG